MALSLRLNEQDTRLIRSYARLKGLTVSELVRRSVLERIEDEFDLQAYNKAWAAYEAEKTTYTLDEVEKELGLR